MGDLPSFTIHCKVCGDSRDDATGLRVRGFLAEHEDCARSVIEFVVVLPSVTADDEPRAGSMLWHQQANRQGFRAVERPSSRRTGDENTVEWVGTVVPVTVPHADVFGAFPDDDEVVPVAPVSMD